MRTGRKSRISSSRLVYNRKIISLELIIFLVFDRSILSVRVRYNAGDDAVMMPLRLFCYED